MKLVVSHPNIPAVHSTALNAYFADSAADQIVAAVVAAVAAVVAVVGAVAASCCSKHFVPCSEEHLLVHQAAWVCLLADLLASSAVVAAGASCQADGVSYQ